VTRVDGAVDAAVRSLRQVLDGEGGNNGLLHHIHCISGIGDINPRWTFHQLFIHGLYADIRVILRGDVED